MKSSDYQRTRWLALVGAIITQFALGSVYAWSVFNGALSARQDEPISQGAFSFGLLSSGLLCSSQIAGTFWRKTRHHGVRDFVRCWLLFNDAFQQSDDAVAERRCAGWTSGRRRLSVKALLCKRVPGT